MKVLLVTPPMSDLNTPYPATAYLAGFLRQRGHEVRQEDWSLQAACRLFSTPGLARLQEALPRRRVRQPQSFAAAFDRHLEIIDAVVAMLQGDKRVVEDKALQRGYLPEGVALRNHYDALEAGRLPYYESLDARERACYLATTYLRDLADLVAEIEPGFTLTAYAAGPACELRFAKVLRCLARQEGKLLHAIIDEIAGDALQRQRPDVLGLTVPFPGALIGALRVAQTARRVDPALKIIMGGGYANCYLRSLSDARLFDFVDFLTLDDGERPLACILEHLAGERAPDRLLRTFVRREGNVVLCSSPDERDVPFTEAATPSYAGLPLQRYLATWNAPTAAQRFYARHWNKLTLAHGCYWGKCTFCDLSLDYVRRYEPQRVDRLVAQIETLIAETGHRGFHWVDEAAPPALLRALSERLLERNVRISWWGNIRFERAFTPQLAGLMARAGCVKVSGGLEVASDRLLERINKGVTVAQVARVAKAFAEHGVHVHAYLMYGFPSQTVQETVDSLELVRQMFVAGCLHSGHWHRFDPTEHSPIGARPEDFGIRLRRRRSPRRHGTFARYPIRFRDATRVNHDLLGPGLWDAQMSYQRGHGLDRPAHTWFPVPVPTTTVNPETIAAALGEGAAQGSRPSAGQGS